MVGSFEIHGTTPVTQAVIAKSDSVLHGFSGLQTSNKKAGFKVNLSSKVVDPHHITYQLDPSNRGIDHAICSYLDPARFGPSVQHGSVNLGAIKADRTPPLSIDICFAKAYAYTPKVVLWLTALDFPAGTRLGIEARATNITPAGFTLFITGLMDLPHEGNMLTWVAFEDNPNIISGTCILGKGTEYRCSQSHPEINENSEVFIAFNMFSGPPDCIDFVLDRVYVKPGTIGISGHAGDPVNGTMGFSYIVFNGPNI